MDPFGLLLRTYSDANNLSAHHQQGNVWLFTSSRDLGIPQFTRSRLMASGLDQGLSKKHGLYQYSLRALPNIWCLGSSVLGGNFFEVSRYYPGSWCKTRRPSSKYFNKIVSTPAPIRYNLSDSDIQGIASGLVYDGYDIPSPGTCDHRLYTTPDTWVAEFRKFDNVETPHIRGEMASTFPNDGTGWGSGVLRPFPWRILPTVPMSY
ncbi:hypothetical protein F4824DRAFT_451325 [Ustulina deusta]|nr:hypothetical protein F4824DRAFT_451325 [Ustulina deusta]